MPDKPCEVCKRGFKSRRELLFEAGGGVSGLALAWLLGQEKLLAGSAEAACSATGTETPWPQGSRTLPHERPA